MCRWSRNVSGGIVRRVVLLDDAGDDVVLVTRFLSHLSDSGYSPNTLCAYAYDLRHLVSFSWASAASRGASSGPSTALEFLAYLRRVPSGAPGAAAGPGRRDRGRAGCCPAATVAAGAGGDVELLRLVDRRRGVHERGQPDAATRRSRLGAGSRIGTSRSSVRRAASSRCQLTVRVRLPIRLPRPLSADDVDVVLSQHRHGTRSGDLLVDARRWAATGRGAVSAAGGRRLRPAAGHDPQAR